MPETEDERPETEDERLRRMGFVDYAEKRYEKYTELIQRLLTYVENSQNNCSTDAIDRTRFTQETIDYSFNQGIISSKESEEYTEQLRNLVKRYMLSCQCKKRKE